MENVITVLASVLTAYPSSIIITKFTPMLNYLIYSFNFLLQLLLLLILSMSRLSTSLLISNLPPLCNCQWTVLTEFTRVKKKIIFCSSHDLGMTHH